jgi:2-desacetyl-2-hydroxyethyl bacteriochlorophyllide A dehydrogenase
VGSERLLSRRLVVRKPRELAIETIQLPPLTSSEIVVKTSRTLISTGTELTFYTGDFPKGSFWDSISRYPITLGYSNCGTIVSVGEGVKNFSVGDRVVSWAPHADYVREEEESACRVPDGVSDEEATFAEVAATAMNAVRLAHISLGECVVIIGAGLLGQLAAQFSKLCGGFPTIVADLSEYRLEIAKRLGATATVNPERNNIKETVASLSKNRGADVVIESTGSADAISTGLSLTKHQGRYVLLGSPRGSSNIDFHDEVNMPSRIIIGAHSTSHPAYETPFNPWTNHRNKELFLDLVHSGIINAKDLITNHLKWTDAQRIYDDLADPLGERLQVMGVILDYT